MKTLSFLLASFFLCMSTIAGPINSNFIKVGNDKTLPDLSKDENFVKSVNEIFSLQVHITESNSPAILNNSFNKIGISILALKNKYAALNDNANASLIINAAIDKLVQQGRITNLNSNYSSTDLVCLRQFYTAIVICLKTSANYTAFGDCVREAYAQFVACVQAHH